MLTRVTHEISPSGRITVSELSGDQRNQALKRVGDYAAILLPEFLRVQAKESHTTNRERLLREAAQRDQFLDSDVNLTRDAFAGQGEVVIV